VLSGASGLKNSFPDWTKRELCALARRLVDTACRLHEMGILFGCFNPASVYVKSPEEVYFTDTDCWQIEGYPVLSQNITFTPPELAAEQSGLRLYTLDQDNYQVALLTFMIMMPGKYPYAKRRKGGADAGLRDMSFTFSIM
jgi:DNA-binding helix-hairpin-helix protein with protein kinase domain